jgi:hypothetical protein
MARGRRPSTHPVTMPILQPNAADIDLGAAGPPCGRFGATAAWYRVSLPTHKVLSALKALALPPALSAARPKRLRFALFTRAGRLLSHAGGLVLRISRAAERLALVAQALPAG